MVIFPVNPGEPSLTSTYQIPLIPPLYGGGQGPGRDSEEILEGYQLTPCHRGWGGGNARAAWARYVGASPAFAWSPAQPGRRDVDASSAFFFRPHASCLGEERTRSVPFIAGRSPRREYVTRFAWRSNRERALRARENFLWRGQARCLPPPGIYAFSMKSWYPSGGSSDDSSSCEWSRASSVLMFSPSWSSMPVPSAQLSSCWVMR